MGSGLTPKLAMILASLIATCPVLSWDGAYAGLGMGYGSSALDSSARLGGDTLGLDLGSSGALLSGYSGYGWSSGGLYLGSEASYGFSSMSSQLRLNDTRLDVDARESWALSGMLGGLVNHDTLLYGRAGYQQRKYDLSLPGFRDQDWLGGLRVGAGAEFRVWGRSSIRFEYNHVWHREGRAYGGGDTIDYRARESWFEAGGILRF